MALFSSIQHARCNRRLAPVPNPQLTMPSQRPHSPYCENSSRRAWRNSCTFTPLGQRVSSRSRDRANGGTQDSGISGAGGSWGWEPLALLTGARPASGEVPGPAAAKPGPRGLAPELPASRVALERCPGGGWAEASAERKASELTCSGWAAPPPRRGVPWRPPMARWARATPPLGTAALALARAAGDARPPGSAAAGAAAGAAPAAEGLPGRGSGPRGVPVTLKEDSPLARLRSTGKELAPPSSWLAPWPSSTERRSDTLLPVV